MRKAKYIALALMTSVILSGAGYAYWTDYVTITSTVNTGKFEVTFVSSDLNEVNEDKYVYVNVTPVNSHTLNLSINNIYPGGGGGFSYKVMNTGSIPVKFDKALIQNLFDPDGLDANRILTYSISLQKYDKNDKYLSGSTGTSAGNSTTSLCTKLNEKLQDWKASGSPLILQPGEYLVVSNPTGDSVVAGYFVSLNENEEGYQNAHINYDLLFNFKQWNQN